MENVVTLDTKACFLPAFLQVKLRKAVFEALMPSYLAASPVDFHEAVADHMLMGVGELSDLVDISFLSRYLDDPNCSACPSERNKLVRPQVRSADTYRKTT